ncbi:MAG: hypothetical protein K8T25_06185 [Planctomycetia bacterium]|nr:hypothetical protein [Planctomycetia bacterium]
MHNPPSAVRKAAILISAVDRQTADLLLQRMAPAEAAAVRRAAIALDDIDAAERDVVLAEFQQLAVQTKDVGTGKGTSGRGGTHEVYSSRAGSMSDARRTVEQWFLVPSKRPAGIDLCGPDIHHLRNPVETDSAESVQSEAASENVAEAWAWMQRTGSDALAGFLSHEHAQTVAAVLTRLGPQQAATVLSRLRPELQTAVLQRLAQFDDADPEILLEVQRSLETWVVEQYQRRHRGGAGLTAAARILDATQAQARQAMLANVARQDSDLSRRLARLSPSIEPPTVVPPAKAPLTFADLLRLSNDALAAVVAAADPEVAVLALVGEANEVLSRLESRLSSHVAAALRNSLVELGPIRLSDVEAAQQQLVEVARELQAASQRDAAAAEPVDVIA